MSDLKPCPFCGHSNPDIRLTVDGSEMVGYNKTYSVICGGCHACAIGTTKQCRNGWATEGHEAAKKRAIENWNKRVTND